MPVVSDLIIARVDKARQLLVEAKDAPSAKRVVDMAHAAEVYARRQKLSEETIDHAHAIKIDAMRLLGEHLAKAPKRGLQHSKGGGSKGSKREPLPDSPPTLRDLGITKKESAQAQAVAKIAKDGNGLYQKIRSNQASVSEAKRAIIRQEANRGLPDCKTPHQLAHEDPGRRWAEAAHKISVLLTSVRDAGGITPLTKKWSTKRKQEYAAELREIVGTLQTWIKVLEV